MKIIVEGLKAGPGLHQEQRPVHGAHGTHMQRFWVGGASTHEEHTEHAKLHEKAATEHGALAKKHGAGLYPDHMPGADPTHAIAAEVALNPHWDPDRGDAHKALAALHRQAAGMAHGLARRVQTGLPTAHQEHHLATVREHIDDQTFYARPSAEVADDLHREREGEDRDAYERDHDDDTPFDVGHPAARLERLKSQMSLNFGGDAGSRGLHLEQKQVGGHTQGVWVKSKDEALDATARGRIADAPVGEDAQRRYARKQYHLAEATHHKNQLRPLVRVQGLSDRPEEPRAWARLNREAAEAHTLASQDDAPSDARDRAKAASKAVTMLSAVASLGHEAADLHVAKHGEHAQEAARQAKAHFAKAQEHERAGDKDITRARDRIAAGTKANLHRKAAEAHSDAGIAWVKHLASDLAGTAPHDASESASAASARANAK